LALTTKAAEALERLATERKRGALVSELILEYARGRGRGASRKILGRIESQVEAVEAKLDQVLEKV
jgi:hypothetical protein